MNQYESRCRSSARFASILLHGMLQRHWALDQQFQCWLLEIMWCSQLVFWRSTATVAAGYLLDFWVRETQHGHPMHPFPAGSHQAAWHGSQCLCGHPTTLFAAQWWSERATNSTFFSAINISTRKSMATEVKSALLGMNLVLSEIRLLMEF